MGCYVPLALGCQKLPKWWRLESFLNTGPYGAENFKILLLQHFFRIPSKPYEDIAYHRGMQAVSLLGNRPSLAKLMALSNFNIGVNGKTLHCRLSRKWLMVKRNGRKFESRGTTVPIQKVLFMSGFLEFGLGSFGAFRKIFNFTNFKTLLFSHFYPISSKLCTWYPNHGAIQAITFFGALPKITKNMGL